MQGLAPKRRLATCAEVQLAGRFSWFLSRRCSCSGNPTAPGQCSLLPLIDHSAAMKCCSVMQRWTLVMLAEERVQCLNWLAERKLSQKIYRAAHLRYCLSFLSNNECLRSSRIQRAQFIKKHLWPIFTGCSNCT